MLRHQDGPATLLSTLPFHLLVSIFEHLEGDDICQLRLVSRDVRSAATFAVRSLRPRNATGGLLTAFARVATLDLSGVEPSTWTETVFDELKDGKQLTSLKLGHRNPITSSGAASIASLSTLRSVEFLESPLTDSGLLTWSALTHLTALSLRASANLTEQSLQVVSHLKSLREVDFGSCYAVNDLTLRALGSLPFLAKVDLASCDAFTAVGLAALGRSGSVRRLLLPACWHLDDDILATIASSLPDLECLSLFEGGESVSDVGLCHLSVLTRLTALDLGYSCWCHTASGLHRLVSSLPELSMLSVAGAQGATDQTMESIAAMPHLTSLDISECQQVTAKGMRSLRQLPALQDLNAGWNLRLSDASLVSLPPTLTKLDLSYCGDLSQWGLAVVAQLPDLRVLVARRCFKVGDASLEALSRCTTLHQLDVSYTAVTSRGLRALSTLSKLASLNLSGCHRATTVLGLGALSSLRSLRSLDVSNNPRLDDGCMQAMSFVSQLRNVSLRGCTRIGDHGIAAFFRILKLTALDLTGCRGVTYAAVTKLKKKLPHLRQVSFPNLFLEGGCPAGHAGTARAMGNAVTLPHAPVLPANLSGAMLFHY